LVWVGTVAVIGAHAWWSTDGYESLGIGIVLVPTLVWQAGFLVAAEWARRREYALLVASFASIVVFYTPLTAYSIERLLGVQFKWNDFDDFYPYVSGGWIFLELTAIGVAILAIARYRRPFLMLPLTLFAGFLAMDGATRACGRLGRPRRRRRRRARRRAPHAGRRRRARLSRPAAVRILAAPGLRLAGELGPGAPLRRPPHARALPRRRGRARARRLARAVTYLVAGGVAGWAALSVSAHGLEFPFLLMLGGIGFIGLAVWLARVDSPIRRWLGERGLPPPQRDLAF
jgi:hypothetical protein